MTLPTLPIEDTGPTAVARGDSFPTLPVRFGIVKASEMRDG